MNERIQELAMQAWDYALDHETVNGEAAFGCFVNKNFSDLLLEKFAELIIQECAACCGSQADKKNIRRRFALPVESDIKYPGPELQNSITSQYEREYNIPK